MADCKFGTIVWVQRKNGSWWPGRILRSTELSPSHSLSPGRNGAPVKLLGRDNATVGWYNLEKSKRVKPFRCGEFDDCIRKAKFYKVFPSRKFAKYACRAVAIIQALDLEKKELTKKRKIQVAEQIGAVCRAKRSRCIYLPPRSKNCLEHTGCAQSFKVSPSSFREDGVFLQAGSAGENSSTRPAESYSSKNDSWNEESAETVKHISGSHEGRPGNKNYKENDEFSYLSDFSPEKKLAVVMVKQKLKTCCLTRRSGVLAEEQSYLSSRNGTLNKQDPCRPESALPGVNLEHPGSKNRSDKTKLIDADSTIEASYQAQHVPLVSLMSKLNGKAIVGHPIEIEALESGFLETLLPKISHQVFGNAGTSMLQLTWRTSPRTPVSYLPTSSFVSTQEHEAKLGYIEPGSRSCTTNGKLKPGKSLVTGVFCVPVKLIMTKLLGAVGLQH